MSGPEERERAVGLYFTTPMTTAQVGEAPGLSDQAVLGTPVGEGSPVCRSYGGTHHPAGDKGQGDRNRCRAAEAGRRTARRGRRVLLQFFLSNFCTIFPQYGLPVSSRNCTI